jgi:hypothetical protein
VAGVLCVAVLAPVIAVTAVHAATVPPAVHRNEERDEGDQYPVGVDEVDHGCLPFVRAGISS